MNKHYLQSKVKSTGTTYLFWFFFGAHYAYLGMWGIQFLYWFTLGGVGVWALIDLFLIPGKVSRYNAKLFAQIDQLEKKERDEDMARNISMIQASKTDSNE
ncbi:TM2 domain-containing protein [Limibacter armeniacum]|uniref:TM2 domain-containing protein n=1 Tax=Limibacter armeniacum TaxID=466084 RepID=UPI002FE68EAD